MHGIVRIAAVVSLALAGCSPDEGACGGPGVICRVAGTGALGFNGDGRAATDTELYLVSAVRPAPDGRLWLMDFNNHRLRAIEADGTVTTVVGTGLHSYAKVGVHALETPLENPIDFGFAPDGTVVLVMLHDPRVIRIAADGVVTLVAGTGEVGTSGDGGPALSATFTEIWGMAVRPDGAILIADGGADRVRVVHPSGGVEAFAGTGQPGLDGDGGPATAATLRHPVALALMADGALLVAEDRNHVIRRVAADGTISTIAGTGSPGYSGDGGAATAAMLHAPGGIGVAPSGDIFVADTLNHRVRRIAPDGVIGTVAGTGVRGNTGDGGPAGGAALRGPAGLSVSGGRLYIADQLNACVRAVEL